MSKFKIGDRVRVRKPADVERSPRWVDEMDKFDGTVQVIRQVRTSDEVVRFDVDPMNWNFHFDWLEPIRSWVPQGYSVIEIAVPDAMREAIGEGKALVWKKPVIGERFCGEEGTETSTRDYSHYYYPVLVPTRPPAVQYREPTAADVGKMVEVRSACFPWIEGSVELLAVLAIDLNQRFICRNRMYPNNVDGYDYARIKIEEVTGQAD